MPLAGHEVGDGHERRPAPAGRSAAPAGRRPGARPRWGSASPPARGSGARPSRSWPGPGRRRAASPRSPGGPTGWPRATWMMSGPWVETTRAARRRVRCTACPGGRIEWAWTTSNGQLACSRASARASVGAIHQPQVPYDHGLGGATKGTGSIGIPSSSQRRQQTRDTASPGRQRRQPGARRRQRRDGPAQRQHAHLGAGVACRQRLPVGPDPEHRIRRRRVPLGHDGDSHGGHLGTGPIYACARWPASAAQWSRPLRCRTASRCSARLPSSPALALRVIYQTAASAGWNQAQSWFPERHAYDAVHLPARQRKRAGRTPVVWPRGLERALRSFGPDVVVVWEYGPTALRTWAWCRRRGIPLVIFSELTRWSARGAPAPAAPAPPLARRPRAGVHRGEHRGRGRACSRSASRRTPSR